MRIDEITKSTFLQRLANPVLGEVLDELARFADDLHDLGWDVDYTKSADGTYVTVKCTNRDSRFSGDWIKRVKIYNFSYMPNLTDEDITFEMVDYDKDKIIFNINILRRRRSRRTLG